MERDSLSFGKLRKLWNSLEIVEFIGKHKCIWRLAIVVYIQPTFFRSTHHGKPDRKCFVGVHSASQSGYEFESYFITFGLLEIVEIVENCGKLMRLCGNVSLYLS